MKNNLLVLFGLPGCGKSVFIRAWKKSHPDYKVVDVYDYIKKYKKADGSVKDKKFAQKAYQKMYTNLQSINQNTVLELGTSLPKFNLRQLKKLKENNNLSLVLIFCLLDRKKCLKQVKKKGIPFRKDFLMRRIKRDFPKVHQKICRDYNLNCHTLDMEKDIKENIKILEKLI